MSDKDRKFTVRNTSASASLDQVVQHDKGLEEKVFNFKDLQIKTDDGTVLALISQLSIRFTNAQSSLVNNLFLSFALNLYWFPHTYGGGDEDFERQNEHYVKCRDHAEAELSGPFYFGDFVDRRCGAYPRATFAKRVPWELYVPTQIMSFGVKSGIWHKC